VVAMYFLGENRGTIVTATYLLLCVAALYIPENWLIAVEYPEGFKIRFLASFTLISLVSYHYESTKRKNYENIMKQKKELEQLNKELDEAVKHLAIELSENQKAKREISKAKDAIELESKTNSVLLSNISYGMKDHVRNILKISSELLKDPTLTEDMKEKIRAIRKDAEDLQFLKKQIPEFSKMYID